MENRRSFLTRAALGVAAAGVSSAPAASDQFTVGFIGTGARACACLIPQFKFNPDFRIAAVYDVYKPNLEQAAHIAGDNIDSYGDYRRVLDRKDIDVVVIATPDHWHCPMVIEACQAGKDMSVEKPLSNDIDMCLKAVEAARKYKRVVQVGLMQRSSLPFMEGYKVFQTGILGKVRHVVVVNPKSSAPRRAVGGAGGRGASSGRVALSSGPSTPPPDLDWEMFQGPAPRRPYTTRRQHSWRSYWEYGGSPLSDDVHAIDIAHWYLGVTEPASRTAAAYGWFNHPHDDRVPDTIEVAWQYPNFVADYSSRSEDERAFGMHLWGDEGTLYVHRFGYEVRPVRRGAGGTPAFEPKSAALHDELPNYQASFESDSGRHILNFLACIKSRERPVADIEIGAVSTIPTLMGDLSVRNGGRTIAWNGHGAEPLV